MEKFVQTIELHETSISFSLDTLNAPCFYRARENKMPENKAIPPTVYVGGFFCL